MANIDPIKILQYVEKIENPTAITVAVVLCVFLFLRKFTTSEYVTAGKEAMESLKNLYDSLYQAHEELKKEYSELKKDFESLQIEIDSCRQTIEELTNLKQKG